MAVAAGAFGSFMHQGQICMTTGRHLVHESLHDEYVERARRRRRRHLPGRRPGRRRRSPSGPIIDGASWRQIDAIVQGVGREPVPGWWPGGPTRACSTAPTVLADVDGEMTAWRDEIFGPVAPVRSFRTTEEAVALATENEYGLSLGILGDVGEAMKIADAVPSGIVHINEQTVADEANAPFGGVGASGTGSRSAARRPTSRPSRRGSGSPCARRSPPYPF